MKPIFLALIMITVMACDKPPGVESKLVFWVENKSNMRISTYTSYQYPDTSIPDLTGREWDLETVSPAGKAAYFFSHRKWSDVFGELPADTLSVFVFHADTVQKYSWQEIRTDYKILKRIDISQKDLENMNNTIPYP